jgi:hypothetical protein
MQTALKQLQKESKKLSEQDLTKYVELCHNCVLDMVAGRDRQNSIDILENYITELEQKYNFDSENFFIESNSGYIFPESEYDRIAKVVKKNYKFFKGETD